MVILTVDPPTLNVPAAGGISVHVMVNSGETRVAFKIKSSNNQCYRVNSVFGFVNPSSATALEITQTNGPPREDKLVIQYVEVSEGARSPQSTFKMSAPTGEIIFPKIAN